RAAQLATADLSRFTVLILPDESSARKYSDVLGEKAISQLNDFVTNGGVIIGVAGAVSFLASEGVELLDVGLENAAIEKAAQPLAKIERTDGRVPGRVLADESEFRKAIEAGADAPDSGPGAILRVRVDPEHWLTAGVKETVDILSPGRLIFSPITLDKGVNAAIFQAADQVVASGFLWKENREQLAHKPLEVVEAQGRGLVIGFTADPNYRGYTDGAALLFLNAVFRSQGHITVTTSEEYNY